MRQIIAISFIAMVCFGCARHRDFTRVDLNGTFQVTSVSGTTRTRVLPEESLREGSIVTIKQTQSLLIFSDETTSRTLDLRSDEVYMKGNSIIYKPSQGAYIILGPAISQQYDRITAKDDGLTVKSRSFEGGIMFFLIPWKEGGTTTVKLRRLDSQHDHQQKR